MSDGRRLAPPAFLATAAKADKSITTVPAGAKSEHKNSGSSWFPVSLPSWRIMRTAIDFSARRTIDGFMVRPVSNSAQLVVFASGLLAAIGLCAMAGQGSQSAPTTAASARRTQQPSSPAPAQKQTPRTPTRRRRSKLPKLQVLRQSFRRFPKGPGPSCTTALPTRAPKSARKPCVL